MLINYRKKFGLNAVIRLPFYPLMLLYVNTLRLIKTLWNARVLSNGKWGEYNRFRSHNGINSLFYWTQAINFDRFGRNGTSPYVSTGNYYLGNWWHLSLTSIYLYWRLGAMLPLLSMFGWLGFHLLWLLEPNLSGLWIGSVMFLAFISSYFYAGAFVVLNYNAFGWLFMPLGLYGLLTGNDAISAIAWLAASLGSITVVVIAGYISLVWSIITHEWGPLLAFIPAGIKIASHLFLVDDVKQVFQMTAKAIGLIRGHKVKYEYNFNGCKQNIILLYILLTWLPLSISAYVISYEYGVLLLSIVLLYLINQKVARFSDEQNLYMAMFSLGTSCVIVLNDMQLLIFFWLMAAPLPILIGAAENDTKYDNPKSYAPFKVYPIIRRCEAFLRYIPEEARILLVLNDPQGQFDRLFDGYRVINEALYYACNLTRKLAFPDFYAIFDNNDVCSPDFWGGSPKEAVQNSEQWNADYVLVYGISGHKINADWLNAGFVLESQLDWKELMDDLRGECCWPVDNPIPVWWLLRIPASGE